MIEKESILQTNLYDLIIFDWDGTLANSTQLITKAICQSAVRVGLPELAESEASQIIGLGFREAVNALYGEVSEQQMQNMIAYYAYYYEKEEDSIPLFDGAHDMLTQLKQSGIQLAVASGKGRQSLNKAFMRSQVSHLLSDSRCVDECHSKPHPQMILELIDICQVTQQRTLMIGDTSFDLQMAENAGVHSLGVTFGAHGEETLLAHNPLKIFHDFSSLSDYLIGTT